MKKIPLKYVCIISWISWALGIILILLGCWLKLLWLVIAAIFELLAAIAFYRRFQPLSPLRLLFRTLRRLLILPPLRRAAERAALR